MSRAVIEHLSHASFANEVAGGQVTVFKYTPNSRGFVFLQVCAALLLTGAVVTAALTSFEPLYWLFLTLLLGGGAFLVGWSAMLVFAWQWTLAR